MKVVSCKNCGAKYLLDDDDKVRDYECSACAGDLEFLESYPSTSPEKSVSTLKKDSDNSKLVYCTNCRLKYRLDPEDDINDFECSSCYGDLKYADEELNDNGNQIEENNVENELTKTPLSREEIKTSESITDTRIVSSKTQKESELRESLKEKFITNVDKEYTGEKTPIASEKEDAKSEKTLKSQNIDSKKDETLVKIKKDKKGFIRKLILKDEEKLENEDKKPPEINKTEDKTKTPKKDKTPEKETKQTQTTPEKTTEKETKQTQTTPEKTTEKETKQTQTTPEKTTEKETNKQKTAKTPEKSKQTQTKQGKTTEKETNKQKTVKTPEKTKQTKDKTVEKEKITTKDKTIKTSKKSASSGKEPKTGKRELIYNPKIKARNYHGLFIEIGLVAAFIGVIDTALTEIRLFNIVFIAIGLTIFVIGLIQNNEYKKSNEREKLVREKLLTLPKDFYVLSYVKLPKADSEINHVVVGPTGIFTILTKNYKSTNNKKKPSLAITTFSSFKNEDADDNRKNILNFDKKEKTAFEDNNEVKQKSIKLTKNLIEYLGENGLNKFYIEPLVCFINKKISIINIVLTDEDLFLEELLTKISNENTKLDYTTLNKCATLLSEYSAESS